VLESHCHIDYITSFNKLKNQNISVKTNNGVIDHFEDYKMNVCLHISRSQSKSITLA
jgi:hypothetical protein